MTAIQSRWGGALAALICGALILFLSLGVRHGFGLFLQPVSLEHGWGREVFAFSIALQNLVWGASQPFAGMLADRFGARWLVVGGAGLYAAGLWMMSWVGDPLAFHLGAGVLIGLGLAGTTFPVIFGVVSRLVPPEMRSLAMGITMSVGSLGQFVLLPGALALIGLFDWSGALAALSVLALLIAPLALGMREPPRAPSAAPEANARAALAGAFAARDFWLLTFGFFVCGFQVVFIATHLPAYLADNGVNVAVATTVLALIGLVNIAGTYYAGLWGGRYDKPKMLVWIYLGRAAAIAGFAFMLPVSATTAYVFGVLMGLFWLSTVPLTNGVVASVWGVRHMSMLGGIVFFGHQLGAFAGGWLGGRLFDMTGSYDVAWAVAAGLSILAAALNLPIRERAREAAA